MYTLTALALVSEQIKSRTRKWPIDRSSQSHIQRVEKQKIFEFITVFVPTLQALPPSLPHLGSGDYGLLSIPFTLVYLYNLFFTPSFFLNYFLSFFHNFFLVPFLVFLMFLSFFRLFFFSQLLLSFLSWFFSQIISMVLPFFFLTFLVFTLFFYTINLLTSCSYHFFKVIFYGYFHGFIFQFLSQCLSQILSYCFL